MSQLNKTVIKEITEEVGMPEFEYDIYEASINDLQNFATKIIELYESDDYDNSLVD